MPKKKNLHIIFGMEGEKNMGKYAPLGEASKGMEMLGKAVKCADCPSPEICAKEGCVREKVNKNFMGSKGKPIDLDIEF